MRGLSFDDGAGRFDDKAIEKAGGFFEFRGSGFGEGDDI